jgi:C-terminal processing protease CtpA/Prc
MGNRIRILLLLSAIIAMSLACQISTNQPEIVEPTRPPTDTPLPTDTPTALPPIPVEPGEDNPDEPVFITGHIPYTSPFFINSISQPFVMLEDQAGFVQRDLEFEFPLEGQTLGPVEIQEDETLNYYLSLPAIPQGTMLDVDNNGAEDAGVQIFAIAYWSNTWGDTYLEERDGTGWSTAYASTITDPELDNEIQAGILVVWAPDDEQNFPTGFGEDGLIFTEDDPTGPIPAGYNLVDINQEPFIVYKEARPYIILNEGVVAVNDYLEMGYDEAFNALYDKVSVEYPFTDDKDVDWQALYDEFAPRVDAARGKQDFYRAMRDFSQKIPDGHVYISLDGDVFFEERGGSFGLVLAELSDGRVIVTNVLSGTPGDAKGFQVGAEIIEWNGQPVSEALDQVIPYFGPFSTDHHRRLEQVTFLTRVSPGDKVSVSFRNPDGAQEKEVDMTAAVEYDSLLSTIPSLNEDELALPLEGLVMDDSGLGYIRISTFSADYNMMARLWDHYLENLIDSEVPGLILDMRANGGGASSMANDFAGYFTEGEIELYQRSYYNEKLGQFEAVDHPVRIKPGPRFYDGEIAVLVSPNCVSACEGFVYSLQQTGRATVIGHYPTAGAFGEVGRGQYTLPEDYSMQFPTGRPETLDGELLIEGTGVVPDIIVPVTIESALGQVDAVLEAAIQALK